MNLALGVDLVEVARIAAALEKHPQRFLTRHFTARETPQCRRDSRRLAARWAAKEAAVKALGTGIGPVGWHDVEVVIDADGVPELVLHGPARRKAELAGLTEWAVTLTHTDEHAVAVVAAVGLPRE